MRATAGLIIKRQNKGEHDQLLTLYTKKYGKIELIARGIRKAGAKLAGHAGLFYLSEVTFVSGAHHGVLTSAREMEHFSKLKHDTAKMRAARHIARLVDSYTLHKEKDEDMFHLVVGAFDYLHHREMKTLELKFFLRYFEFKFLSALGYEPEDKTIARALEYERVMMTERDLDELGEVFSGYFNGIYSRA